MEKLKEIRSGKRKYEIEELENIYDEVDEKEYSNTVLKRQRDDWIVDDGMRVFQIILKYLREYSKIKKDIKNLTHSKEIIS